MKKLIVTTLLLLGATFTFAGCESKEVQTQLDQTLTVLETMDAEKVMAACDEDTKQAVSVETMQERMGAVYHALAVESVDYKHASKNKEASGDGKTVYDVDVVMTTPSGDVKTTAQLAFTGKNENMKLSWTPQAVLSGLSNDNSLVVETKQGKRGSIFARNGEVLAEDDKDGNRVYPQAALTASCVGYVRAATAAEIESESVDSVPIGTEVGRSGFEKAYQDRLVATSGLKVYLSDAKDQIIFESEPKDGEDITTTIDLKVQQIAADQVSGEFAAVVMVEPSNGQVLAMAEGGSYDPNRWLYTNMSAEEYAANVEAGVIPGNGLFADRFTPGSTQKLSTTYIGLKNGTLTPESGYEIYGEDWAPPGGWGSYKVHRVVPYNGWVDLKSALVYSDNIFFARTALDMGYDAFNNGMKSLGYGEKVPGAYPVQTSQITADGVIADGHETGLADSAYGQYQVQISPLQQTLIYASLQNGGKIMKPCYLMDEKPEVWIDGVATQEHIDFINDALRDAVLVQHPLADVEGAKISAKTGTAEVGSDGSTNLGWICGSDLANPNWTMCVMVNYVEDRGGSDVNAAYIGKIVSELYAQNGGPYVPSGLEQASESDEKK